MKPTILHTCITVYDLEKSLRFYQDVLGLKEEKRIVFPKGDRISVFLADETSSNKIELTWIKDHAPYDLGDNLGHIGIKTDDIDAARKEHERLGIVTGEIKMFNVYFIKDPDGYIIEIIPTKKN